MTVPVLGDTVVEPSDLFSLAFTVPSTIVQASLGEATILDDDAGTPTVSVSGASTTEGFDRFGPVLSQFCGDALGGGDQRGDGAVPAARIRAGGVDAYFPRVPQRDLRPQARPRRPSACGSLATSWRSRRGGGAGSVQRQRRGGACRKRDSRAGDRLDRDDDGTGNKLGLYSSQPVLVEADAGSKLAYFELSLSQPAPEAFR